MTIRTCASHSCLDDLQSSPLGLDFMGGLSCHLSAEAEFLTSLEEVLVHWFPINLP